MQFINSLSLAPDVNDWLMNTRQPRILHIFDRVCNLINERREILSIVTPQIGNGPFNLVVQDDILFSKYLKIDTSVSIFDDQLEIGNLIVDFGKAKFWNPRPDWKSLRANKVGILDQVTPLLNADYQPAHHASLLLTLTRSIAQADIKSSLAVAKQLAGLGMGLTPSGDDFIMGAIYPAWIVHPYEIAHPLVKEIAEITMPLTTSLSAAWIRSAGGGEAGILWHDFFGALLTRGDVQSSFDKLLAVGETSGADALAGFFGVLSAYKERVPMGIK
jgi:hypothetical protein